MPGPIFLSVFDANDLTMKVLLIGGNRFVGRFLLDRLLDVGCEVSVFNRGKLKCDYPQGVIHIIGDRTDYKTFHERFKDVSFDVVIDMVAYNKRDIISIRETFGGRIDQYIFMSSSIVYTVTEGFRCPIKEEDFFSRPADPNTVPDYKKIEYINSLNKRQCDEELQSYGAEVFNVTILRPPFIIGESDHVLMPSYICRILDNDPIVMPDAGLNSVTFAYAPDIAEAIASCLINRKVFSCALNLAQNEILSVREFVKSMTTLLNREKSLIDIPPWFIMKHHVSSDSFPCSNTFNMILDIQRAKELINFQPTPFDIALERSVKSISARFQGSVTKEYENNRPSELALIQEWQKLVARA